MATVGRIANPRGNIEEAIWEREGHPENGWTNPDLLEWIMGWPRRWSALESLAMDGFPKWRRSLLAALQNSRELTSQLREEQHGRRERPLAQETFDAELTGR
jgi:hypothetical protein